jgi:replication factor A1
MHKNIDQLYENIKDLKTKKEFKEEIKKRSKDYDNLLDEDAIAFLIIDELGRNKQNISKISEITPGIETTLFGKITNISKSKNFTRKNGSSGKVINLEISDETSSCNLVLWNKDVELVKNKTIQKGTNVKVINGYIKDGFNGLEINIGRWGLIETEPEDMPNIKTNIDNSKISKNIKGKLISIEPSRAFFRDNGEFGFVTNIKIEKDDGNIEALTLWDKKVKEIQSFNQGDKIEIENLDIKVKNGKKEAHLNGKGSIKKL